MSYPVTLLLPKDYFEKNFRRISGNKAIRIDSLEECHIVEEDRRFIKLGRHPLEKPSVSLND